MNGESDAALEDQKNFVATRAGVECSTNVVSRAYFI
jgi:hypothetical protein